MMDRWRDKRNSCGTVCKGSNAWRYYCVQTLGIRGMSDVCVACIKTQACPLVVQITYNTARSISDLNHFAFQGNVKKQHNICILFTLCFIHKGLTWGWVSNLNTLLVLTRLCLWHWVSKNVDVLKAGIKFLISLAILFTYCLIRRFLILIYILLIWDDFIQKYQK